MLGETASIGLAASPLSQVRIYIGRIRVFQVLSRKLSLSHSSPVPWYRQSLVPRRPSGTVGPWPDALRPQMSRSQQGAIAEGGLEANFTEIVRPKGYVAHTFLYNVGLQMTSGGVYRLVMTEKTRGLQAASAVKVPPKEPPEHPANSSPTTAMGS